MFYNKVIREEIPYGRNSSYSFIPILSELNRCFDHGLKICMLFWILSSDYVLLLFLQVELSHISSIIYKKLNGQVIPCRRNSSYIYTDSFNTSLVFWSWSEDMHVVWI